VKLVGNVVSERQKLIMVLLKSFFSPESKTHAKVLAFQVLFIAFPKRDILSIYKQPLADLIQIAKTMIYLDLMETQALIRPGTPYKEFHDCDKTQIVKKLVDSQNSNPVDLLRFGAHIVVDFEICDFDVVHALETRLKSVGGNEAITLLKAFTSSIIRNSMYYRVVRESVGEKHAIIPTNGTDENVPLN
jgi:hypothetical protein